MKTTQAKPSQAKPSQAKPTQTLSAASAKKKKMEPSEAVLDNLKDLADTRIHNLCTVDLVALHYKQWTLEGQDQEFFLARCNIPRTLWHTPFVDHCIIKSLIHRIHFFPDDRNGKFALSTVMTDFLTWTVKYHTNALNSAIVLAYSYDQITPSEQARLTRGMLWISSSNNEIRRSHIYRRDVTWISFVFGCKEWCRELLEDVLTEPIRLIFLMPELRRRRWVLGFAGRLFFWKYLWENSSTLEDFTFGDDWKKTKRVLSPWERVRLWVLTVRPVLVALQIRAAARVYAPDAAGTAVVAAEFEREAKKMRLK